MKKRILSSFIVFLLMLGIVNGVSLTQAEAAGLTEMSVLSIKLPVYKENPNYSSKLEKTTELSFNDQVSILKEEGNAAKIKIKADGKEGWVYKDYLSSNPSAQTWLVKEWRNVRETPSSTEIKGTVVNHSKVTVLGFDAESNSYLIKTEDGLQGWIYGSYLKNETTKMNKGSNVIPYDFDQEGKDTNKISLFTPLNTSSKVTADQINRYIAFKIKGAKSNMFNMGSAYLEAQNTAKLNAIYLLAHSGLETKWGTSGIVDKKYNFYGINAIDLQPAEGAYTYSSPRDGIIAGAIFINRTYVNRDKNLPDPFPQPTLDNMRFNGELHQYATDEAWAGKIANLAKEFSDFTTATSWKIWDGKWYYFKSEGILQTGWLQTGGKWYYLDQYGVMQTGWQSISGKWYFLNSAGDMKTGWLSNGGKWYFLNQAGDMKTGWLYNGGKWYFLDTSGAMKTGWLSNGGKWYYLNNSGAMQTGWVKVGSKWYYLYSDGHMASNTKIGGYRLGKDGAML